LREMQHNLRAIWLLRGLLAVMLAFGVEILLWTDPPGNTAADWLLKAVTYLALAAITLDLAARYRIRDVYGLMLVVPVFALLAGLLINPGFAHTEFPNTLLTRVLGAIGTFGLFAVGLILTLTDGNNSHYRRLFLGFSGWLGFYWGVWVRWTPELSDLLTDTVTLEKMLLHAALFISLIVGLFAAFTVTARRSSDLHSDDMKMSIITWGGVIVTLIIVLIIRALEDAIEIGPLLASAGLIVVSWGILWSQHSDKGRTLFDKHVPSKPISPLWIGLSIVLFVGMTVIGYNRPLIDINGYSQYSFMEILFVIVGFTWFPLAASVMSIRAIDRQSRMSPGY